MDRTQKRCLVGSVVFHGTLLGVLIAGAAFVPPTDNTPPGPVLEIIPTNFKPTDGDTVGGGTPNPQPPKQTAPAQNPVTPPADPPRVNPPQVPKVVPKPPVTKPADPPKATTAKSVEPSPKDLSKKATQAKETPDGEGERKPVRNPKTPIQLADRTTRRPDDAVDKARERRENERRQAQEEAEAAERRREAADAANAARRDLANRLRSGADSISKGAGTSTTIEMPGPGGQAYGPYISYLAQFYRQRWKSPRSSSKDHAYVGASIEVAKDGTLLNWKILESSGVKEVDDSVREVLKRYPRLLALPETTKDLQRTFTIQFRLDADSPL